MGTWVGTSCLPGHMGFQGGYVMSAGPYGLPGLVRYVCRAIRAPCVGTSCLPGHTGSLGWYVLSAGPYVLPGWVRHVCRAIRAAWVGFFLYTVVVMHR